ncbi:hypothetical protein SAMN05421819_3214 [Bryocella elongata]|uniref:Uncharacterized protein n=2 Tax=Bryocella elongata TaxID=863522 RepID=A0A1H6AKB9_9BACT|nr:hypothetical protein SAMN05421819_3214 [Bryocella elongata]
MLPLDPIQAISPALRRTGHVLFTPFRVGRTWKLCATAYLGFASTLFVPWPLLYLAAIPWVPVGFRVFLVVGTLVFTALFFWLYLVFSRLQLAFFDIVVHRGEMVAPAWHRTAPARWRWSLLKAAVGTAISAVVAVPFGEIIVKMVQTLPRLNLAPGHPPDPRLFGAIFGFELCLLLVMGIMLLVGGLLSDFVMPPLALEDAGLAEAFRRLWVFARTSPGQLLGYIAMKFVLFLGGYIGLSVAVNLVLMLVLLVVAVVALLGYVVLHALGVGNNAMLVIGLVIGIPILYGSMFYFMIYGVGILLTFDRAYAAYFLAGRYPLLAEALERSTPAEPLRSPIGMWPPPPPPAPSESQ